MPPQSAILTIDIGLTNCKVSLFSFLGEILAQQSRRYPTRIEHPDWSEQDPKDWWNAVVECVRSLVPDLEAERWDIIAIGVTAHMHGMIAIDQHNQPITNCWTLFDRRSGVEADELNLILGNGIAYKLTGGRLESYTPAAKIYWLKGHYPELFQKTSKFVSPKDMLRILLGGDPVTDQIDAAGTLLYNIHDGKWSDEILLAVGLTSEQLPEIRQSFADAGYLSPTAANQLGLKAGIPLIVGAGDDIEALGAGVLEPGQALEHIGTTGTLITCLGETLFDEHQLVEVYPHAVPGRYLLGGATNAAGRSLDWARCLLSLDDPHSMELPLSYPPQEKSIDPPIYLPFISGERGLLWEPHATGAFLGLREIHTPQDLALSVYYGVAFSMKEFIVAAQNLGVAPTEIFSGTPNEQPQWSQLRADIYGLPLTFPRTPYPTGLGVALLAMLNQGIIDDVVTAVKDLCHRMDQIDPNPQWYSMHERRFGQYEAAIRFYQPFFTSFMPKS
jgi:xylulokinase